MQIPCRTLVLSLLAFGAGCSGAPTEQERVPEQARKALPAGLFKQVGGLQPGQNPLGSLNTVSPGQTGISIFVPWDLCGNDEACLLDAIGVLLDGASAKNLKVALAISDGSSTPPAVKARCQLFSFTFRSTPRTMCVAWDAEYLLAKKAFVKAFGARFDAHRALAYVYFTGACSTNGNEGHCRVDQQAYTAAGYTASRLANAYIGIMDAYLEALPTTPIAFEVHAIFGSAALWTTVWNHVRPTKRVGIAAWWCAERLSVNGSETTPVWPLVQEAAAETFSICQTVGSMSMEPWRFSDSTLGLDYGTEQRMGPTDVTRAFDETMDWAEGKAVHARQARPIVRFRVLEPWSGDMTNPAFSARWTRF